MKTCIKKVFCPVCRKLVACHEEKADHHIQIVCSRGHSLRTWNGVRWKVLRHDEW
jgi:hypothetical protein